MKNKVEILAPAGSYEVFLAVMNAGADAVYLAGNMFGARAYAGNLNNEELIKAIEYCKFHNKKMYLTVNTLLKIMRLTMNCMIICCLYIIPVLMALLSRITV